MGRQRAVLGDRDVQVGDTTSPLPVGSNERVDVDIDIVALDAEERERSHYLDARVQGHRRSRRRWSTCAATRRGRGRPTTPRSAPSTWFLAPVLLVLALPFIALLAVIVKLDSRGPVIFRQTRVGTNGRLFTFYKFRTMHVDARERFPELYAYDYSPEEAETMFFKLATDPRCTRVGRLLRRTSLDELPNVWNVIMGDMSLVGPRPEIPEMLPHYRRDQLAKFTVKPGLTGQAQISGRNLLTFQETIRHDLDYLEKRSVRFDLQVLARTPVVVVQMIGAL